MNPFRIKRLKLLHFNRSPPRINYQKIYKISSEKISANSSENEVSTKKNIINKKKIHSLFKTYKEKNIEKKQQEKWDKLTKPKLPFSQRTRTPINIRKKKIELLQPSMLYHDNHVIHWLRSKYSASVIEKSLYSILPKKKKKFFPLNESVTKRRHREMIQYLENLKASKSREEHIKINPKYFYNRATFEKIKKLKDIFLEYDHNGDGKFQLNEITRLFNMNDIKTSKDEIAKLFFQDKNYKKGENLRLYLNFYEFLKFSLNHDQEFRNFMRKIKRKYEMENMKKNENKKTLYLPMNLNLLLDYFITKSKEKSSLEKIESSISIMDQAIEDKKLLEQKLLSKNNNLTNDINTEKSNVSKKEEETNENNKNEKMEMISSNQNNAEIKYDNINFNSLIEEFSGLFDINKLNHNENLNEVILEDNKNINQKKNIFNLSQNSGIKKQNSSIKNKKVNKNMIFNEYIKNQIKKPSFYEYSKSKNDIIGNAIKQNMNHTTLVKMNMDNYKKYHNIQLAFDATKDQIEQIQKSKIIKPSNSYRLINDFKRNYSLNLLPFLDRKRKNFINNNSKSKKSFLFNYKNLSKSNSIKSFSKKDIIEYNKKYNLFSNNIKNNPPNFRRSNEPSFKKNISKSCIINKSETKIPFGERRKYDYVPIDLF